METRQRSYFFDNTSYTHKRYMGVMQFYLEHKNTTFVGVRCVLAKIPVLPCHHHRRQLCAPPLALLPHYCYRHASHDFRHTFVAPMNLMSVMQFYLEHKKIQTFVGVRRVFAKIRALPCHHHRRQCLSRSSTLLLRAPHPITFIRSSHL